MSLEILIQIQQLGLNSQSVSSPHTLDQSLKHLNSLRRI